MTTVELTFEELRLLSPDDNGVGGGHDRHCMIGRKVQGTLAYHPCTCAFESAWEKLQDAYQRAEDE